MKGFFGDGDVNVMFTPSPKMPLYQTPLPIVADSPPYPPRNKAGLMKKPFISEGGGKGLFTQPSYLPPHLPPPAANGCCSVPSVLRFLRLLVTSPKDPEGGGSFFIPNFQTASKRHIWKKKTLREKFRENEKTYLN